MELVQCSMSRTEPALLLLNPRLDYRCFPPLQHPGVDLTRVGEECNPTIIRAHPPLPLLKKRNHHPVCQSRQCPWLPSNAAETCQPWVLGADLNHPWRFATEELPDHHPLPSASSAEDITTGLRRSAKYSFHRQTTSPVEVKSSPPAP